MDGTRHVPHGVAPGLTCPALLFYGGREARHVPDVDSVGLHNLGAVFDEPCSIPTQAKTWRTLDESCAHPRQKTCVTAIPKEPRFGKLLTRRQHTEKRVANGVETGVGVP
jgi:hypothetical protein